MSRGLRGKNTTGNELKPEFKGCAAAIWALLVGGGTKTKATLSAPSMSHDFSSSQIEMCAAFMFVVSWRAISGIMVDAVRGWPGPVVMRIF